jgi:hypothetical protein
MALNKFITDLVEEINGLLILKASRTLTLEECEILEGQSPKVLQDTINVLEKHDKVDLLIG